MLEYCKFVSKHSARKQIDINIICYFCGIMLVSQYVPVQQVRSSLHDNTHLTGCFKQHYWFVNAEVLKCAGPMVTLELSEVSNCNQSISEIKQQNRTMQGTYLEKSLAVWMKVAPTRKLTTISWLVCEVSVLIIGIYRSAVHFYLKL